MPHLEIGLIHELVDGEVPSSALAPILAHLESCAACREQLDAARNAASTSESLLEWLDEPARTAAETLPVTPRAVPHWSRNLAWAASLLLAVGLGYASRGMINPSLPTPAAPATTEAVTSTAPTEVVAPAPAPVVDNALPTTAPTSAANARGTRSDAQPSPAVAAPPPARPTIAAEPEAVVRQQPLNLAERREALADDARLAAPAARSAPAAGRATAFESQAKALEAPRDVDLSTAVQLLGGSIKLVDGLVPARLEALADEVRVIYPVSGGDLQLIQRRTADSLTWRLAAPAGFPADSLAQLRARVQR